MQKSPKLFFLDVGLVNYRIGFRTFFAKQSLFGAVLLVVKVG